MVLAVVAVLLFIRGVTTEAPAPFIGWAFAILGAVFAGAGLLVLQPNQASVIIVLGSYRGTMSESGFWWVNPLAVAERRRVSLRARNFITQSSKVNDANGNPINISAVVVWQVQSPARAVFEVQDYENFVTLQSETAVRHLARLYPYDSYGENTSSVTLTGDAETVADTLSEELHARLEVAGVRVIETRLTDLSYAPEIAEVMLRRQQATAVVAARTRIVEGAVGMVKLALAELDEAGVVELDEERKATMVSNLLTVLTSEHATAPVVNVGTLSR
ncbi:MAG: SPFH domain-containing protein [Dehalococcoidia bacterium]|nr:SPFH domain-containing protein [Dehalococcoidia bacterium]